MLIHHRFTPSDSPDLSAGDRTRRCPRRSPPSPSSTTLPGMKLHQMYIRWDEDPWTPDEPQLFSGKDGKGARVQACDPSQNSGMMRGARLKKLMEIVHAYMGYSPETAISTGKMKINIDQRSDLVTILQPIFRQSHTDCDREWPGLGEIRKAGWWLARYHTVGWNC